MKRPPLPCLLIAGAGMSDPNFRHTVVLLLEWSDEGAFGLVLNRPTELDVVEHLPAWSGVLAEPAVVHVGGPVETEIAVGLDVTIGRVPALVDLSAEKSNDVRVRVFAGYSGWDGGQLEAELSVDGWHLAGWRPEDLRPGVGDDLWRSVLRRQPGTVAFESTYPDDLSVN